MGMKSSARLELDLERLVRVATEALLVRHSGARSMAVLAVHRSVHRSVALRHRSRRVRRQITAAKGATVEPGFGFRPAVAVHRTRSRTRWIVRRRRRAKPEVDRPRVLEVEACVPRRSD